MDRGATGYRRAMGIGVSIFLIALGLILALALDVNVSGIDLQTVGWILTLVGVGGLALTMYLTRRRGVPVRDEAVLTEQPVVRETPVVREHVVREDPPRY